MIVTEEVAKTKQCQQSYAATSVSRNQNAAGMVHSLLTAPKSQAVAFAFRAAAIKGAY